MKKFFICLLTAFICSSVFAQTKDYIDMTQKVPEGGFTTYERFFYPEKGTGVFIENTANISEKIYDKDNRLVARMMWYDKRQMIRNTTTYEYDEKGRLICECHYDSKMYQENGEWMVDPKMSRLFIKDTTTFEENDDGTYAVTTRNRYSYFPQTEHPDLIIYKKYNKNDVLIRLEEVSLESHEVNEIVEYDDYGNVIYEKYDVEKPYENKIEYSYDGDRVKTKTIISVKTGKQTIIDYKYDSKGNLIEQSYRDSKSGTKMKYNKKGQLIERISTNSNGEVYQKDTFRYDKKTGLCILHIEESPTRSYTRFWYTEFSKDNWKDIQDPWAIAEKLAE